MSFFSSIGNFFGNVASGIGTGLKKVGQVATSVVSKLAPVANFILPGVGTALGAGSDILGNLLADTPDQPAAPDTASPVAAAAFAATGQAAGLQLGDSPSAVAASNALAPTQKKGFWGIGDGKPGVFGIGDGEPGLFGIGTGTNKAKKEAAEAAREQAEDAAKGDGLSPLQIKLKGNEAAAKAAADASNDTPDKASDVGALPWLIGGLLALLAL